MSNVSEGGESADVDRDAEISDEDQNLMGEADADEEEDEEDAGEDDQAVDQGGSSKLRGVNEVNDQTFDELELPSSLVEEIQGTWSIYLKSAESREAAGEAIYAALFDSAPSLQSLFKTPRAVMAMRFMNGLNVIVSQLQDPKALKTIVETLGFQHLDLEVTIPRVVIFRDAIVDLLQVEVGARFAKAAKDGWSIMLNYVGGAYIYVRMKYTDRIKILASSWATANNRTNEELEDAAEDKEEEEAAEEEGEDKKKEGEDALERDAAMMQDTGRKPDAGSKKKGSKGLISMFQGKKKKTNNNSHVAGDMEAGNSDGRQDDENSNRNVVPRTFTEMFMFNAAVMGFGSNAWMTEVLLSFDTIVRNVSNSYRLQEECDVLSLRLAKYKGQINLSEFKAVMLSNLRSLVPKDWNSAHEVAWGWLWENVERMIKALMGKPSVMEVALEKLWRSLDEKQTQHVRREVYAKFFALAPAGQDFFKQSTTRLHFIADKIVDMTLQIFKNPKKMVEDISALGLRHVGYGIPTELFGPFVTACVQVIRGLTDDDQAEEAFRWSLSLISRILVRVINEGSTIVMKAINSNSAKQLRKAVGCSPRGKRAMWMLNIQVGTQSISPLLWAIETGSLEAAKAIFVDLLTIRADRDQYYYGMDVMFERHDDIVKRLCADAPALLPTLLNGLIWRSRQTENGQRRVNYYIKHIIADADGNFAKAIEWLTDSNDPKIICHPVVVLVTDVVWARVASKTFLYGRLWFLFTLLVFITSQSILIRVESSPSGRPKGQIIAIFVCRCFIYIFSMARFLYHHVKAIVKDFRAGLVVTYYCIPVPQYLVQSQDAANLLLTLMLVLMFATEPVIYCLATTSGATEWDSPNFLTTNCQESEQVIFSYSVFSALATILYFLLLVDLTVLNTRISAFVLVCGRVMSEVGLFLAAMTFFNFAFSSAVNALEQTNSDFESIPKGIVALLEVTVGMYSGNKFHHLHNDPVLLIAVVVYVIVTVVFLLNLLVSQLNCAYASTYQDMLGFARLNRGKIIVEAMSTVPHARWESFLDALHLDTKLEFNEGDVGLAGGIQVFEPASANPTTVDMIRRFGGSTSPAMQWPEEDQAGDDEDDRFERMEKLIEKAMKRIAQSKGSASGGGSKGTGSMMESSFNMTSSSNQGSGHSDTHDSDGGSA